MPISTSCIELYANSCAAASPNCLETQQLAGVAASIEQAAVGCSVANTSALPSAVDNEGRWIFVEDIGAYRYSDGYAWKNSYDTTLAVNYGLLLGAGSSTYTENFSGDACYTQSATGGTNWSFVACGTYLRGAALKRDGTIWNWGYRSGVCAAIDSLSPVQEFNSATDWCYVDAGEYHTQALKTDGTMWGYGGLGYFETWTLSNTNSFLQECGCDTFIDMTAGARITHAIKSNGTLWSQGLGCWGSLGNDVLCLRTCSSPVQEMTSSTNWCCVAADNNWNVAAIKTDGTLWGWGQNTCAQIGNNTIGNYSSPVQEITSSTSWCAIYNSRNFRAALKTDGTIWSTGHACRAGLGSTGACCFSSPVQEITSSTNWAQVAGIPNYATAIKTDFSYYVNGGAGFCERTLTNGKFICSIGGTCQVEYVVEFNCKGFNEP